MRAELANLHHCEVPFLSRAAVNLCWYDYDYDYDYKMYILLIYCTLHIAQCTSLLLSPHNIE